MSTLLRPTINSDHIIVTLKLDVDWKKVPVEKRIEFATRLEETKDEMHEFLKEATSAGE